MISFPNIFPMISLHPMSGHSHFQEDGVALDHMLLHLGLAIHVSTNCLGRSRGQVPGEADT